MTFRNPRQLAHRAGFTLIEMLVVMAAFGLCMFVGSTLILTTLKAGRNAETAANQVSQRLELARQFRDDVSRAKTAPDNLDNVMAGPAQLILQMPEGAAVLYRWESNAFERIEQPGGKKESRQRIPVGPKTTNIEFIRSKTGIVTLRITQSSENNLAAHLDLSATLGGNSR